MPRSPSSTRCRARTLRGCRRARSLQRAGAPRLDARSLRARTPARALDRYRSFRLRSMRSSGSSQPAETRALEAAILRQEDVQSLLPRRSCVRRRGSHGRARPPRRAQRTELADARRARSSAFRRHRRAAPDRGRDRSWQDTTARRAAPERSIGVPGRAAPPVRCSSGSSLRAARGRASRRARGRRNSKPSACPLSADPARARAR